MDYKNFIVILTQFNRFFFYKIATTDTISHTKARTKDNNLTLHGKGTSTVHWILGTLQETSWLLLTVGLQLFGANRQYLCSVCTTVYPFSSHYCSPTKYIQRFSKSTSNLFCYFQRHCLTIIPATESEPATAAWQSLGWRLEYVHQPWFHISIFLPIYSSHSALRKKVNTKITSSEPFNQGRNKSLVHSHG